MAVFAILGSLNNYREVVAAEGFIRSMSGAFPGGKKIAAAEINNEKAFSIAGIGIGIILAVVGTLLLSDIGPIRYIVRIDNDKLEAEETEFEKPVRWKF